MFPVTEVNEVKPDGPGLPCELPFAIRLLLDHLYSLAKIETEQACNLAKPSEACSLIIAGFVALDLLWASHPNARLPPKGSEGCRDLLTGDALETYGGFHRSLMGDGPELLDTIFN
jgi:hypothetical protein